MHPLDQENYTIGLQDLAARDLDLARIYQKLGPPPIWARPTGFATLVHIILEQQVSLASARAAYDKLLLIANPLTPTGLLELDDATLKSVGFSRQKTSYCRQLATAIINKELDIEALATLPDPEVKIALIKIKGIGDWTADIYLLMALLRPDIWPKGDLALAVAMQSVKRLPTRPTNDQLAELAESWRPWRAVAARLLWHHYLSGEWKEVRSKK
jgi:DNA-3-methyladenine glycosylase II